MYCGKAFWKRILAFGLTCGFGTLIAGLFVVDVIPEPKPQFNQPRALLEPKEFNKNSNPKPLCKRYADKELFRLRLQHLIITKDLEFNKNLTSKNRKIYLVTLAKLEKRIKGISSKKTPKSKYTLPDESKPVHNLLFVPNCEEY